MTNSKYTFSIETTHLNGDGVQYLKASAVAPDEATALGLCLKAIGIDESMYAISAVLVAVEVLSA